MVTEKTQKLLTKFLYKLYSYQGRCQVSVNITFRAQTRVYHETVESWDPEAVQQRQASVNKKNIDPVNVRVRPVKEQGVDAIAGIDSRHFGARLTGI
jgi:hypothetical protein